MQMELYQQARACFEADMARLREVFDETCRHVAA
jgi:hypothetical protein